MDKLRQRLGAKSKVEGIRLGLMKLQEATEREYLQNAYKKASRMSRKSTVAEIADLDGLTTDGLVVRHLT
jgi:hypothetical protein